MNILCEQVKELLTETDMIAALSNVSACIKLTYPELNWSGFYFNKNKELILGPFQGKPACTHIAYENGVCGETYRSKEAQLVNDVLNHPGHIACDSDSRSELCVPVVIDDECMLMIDLDSPIKDYFTEEQKKEMLEIASLIKEAYLQHHWSI